MYSLASPIKSSELIPIKTRPSGEYLRCAAARAAASSRQVMQLEDQKLITTGLPRKSFRETILPSKDSASKLGAVSPADTVCPFAETPHARNATNRAGIAMNA